MYPTLADLALKSTVVLAVGSAAAFALRRAPAAMRHLLWTMVAAALLLLPVLHVSLPAWRVRSLPLSPLFSFTTQSAADAASTPAVLPARTGLAPRIAGTATVRPARSVDWILIVWAAGIAIWLARLGAGLWTTHRLRREAEPFGTVEGVPILRSGTSTMPITFGIFRPVVLLPSDAAGWTDERRRIVIAHELAHIRRRDCLAQIVGQVAFSIYWFHPLTWWASRQMVREREHASDDLVLAGGVRASDYAALLLDVARSFQPAGIVATAGVAMARRSELEGRMLAILDSNLRRGVVGRAGVLAASVCAMVVVLPLAAMRPAPQEPERNVNFRTVTAGQSAPVQLSQDLLESNDYQNLDKVGQAEVAAHLTENALKLYERALQVRREKFGEQSPEYAAGLINLALAYRGRNGNWQKSAALYRQALPIQEATLGPNHPDVATTLYQLAQDAAGNPHLTADLAKRYNEAMPLYQRALDIRTKAFGTADARVAEVLVAMAQLKNDEGSYQSALKAADASGPSASLTATALESYAGYLDSHDRAAEAGPLLNRAKEIRATRVQQIGSRTGASPGLTGKAARVGSGVTPPKVTYKVEPEYTDQASSEKLSGTVILMMEVGTDGLAHNIQLKQGIGSGLDEKAAEALMLWRFTPATKDGQPITVAATVEVNFKLL